MRLRNSLAASIVGNALLALLSLTFVPIYVRILGVESYGLIGFFGTLQVIISLLDLGIGSATSRELARLRVEDGGAATMRTLVRTLEVVYWSVGCVIVILLYLVSSPLSRHWLDPGRLGYTTMARAMVVMAITFGFRWPSTLYVGGLQGLERQVLLNVVKVSAELLRNLGAVFVLYLISPTLQAFLLWQAIAALLGTAFLAAALWRALPPADGPTRFASKALTRVWRFAAGLSGISLTVMALTQVDKVILGKLLPLNEYGNYMIAVAVAAVPGFVSGAIFATVYPRFSQLVAKGDQLAISSLFRKAAQITATLVAPLAVSVAVFSKEVLYLWSQNAALAQEAGGPLRLLILGSMLNALVVVPYALQLAYAWTKLAFVANLVAISALLPLLLFLVPRFGAIGAALCWFIVNLGYVTIATQVMFRRLLPSEKWRWYVFAVVLPLAVSCGTCGLLKIPVELFWQSNTFGQLAAIGGGLLAGMAITCIVLPETRRLLITFVKRPDATALHVT